MSQLDVPDDSRMEPNAVQTYLDELFSRKLLERRQENPPTYRMRNDVGACIVDVYEKLKSPQVDDLLFHGFRLHSAWKIDIERRQ